MSNSNEYFQFSASSHNNAQELGSQSLSVAPISDANSIFAHPVRRNILFGGINEHIQQAPAQPIGYASAYLAPNRDDGLPTLHAIYGAEQQAFTQPIGYESAHQAPGTDGGLPALHAIYGTEQQAPAQPEGDMLLDHHLTQIRSSHYLKFLLSGPQAANVETTQHHPTPDISHRDVQHPPMSAEPDTDIPQAATGRIAHFSGNRTVEDWINNHIQYLLPNPQAANVETTQHQPTPDISHREVQHPPISAEPDTDIPQAVTDSVAHFSGNRTVEDWINNHIQYLLPNSQAANVETTQHYPTPDISHRDVQHPPISAEPDTDIPQAATDSVAHFSGNRTVADWLQNYKQYLLPTPQAANVEAVTIDHVEIEKSKSLLEEYDFSLKIIFENEQDDLREIFKKTLPYILENDKDFSFNVLNNSFKNKEELFSLTATIGIENFKEILIKWSKEDTIITSDLVQTSMGNYNIFKYIDNCLGEQAASEIMSNVYGNNESESRKMIHKSTLYKENFISMKNICGLDFIKNNIGEEDKKNIIPLLSNGAIHKDNLLYIFGKDSVTNIFNHSVKDCAALIGSFNKTDDIESLRQEIGDTFETSIDSHGRENIYGELLSSYGESAARNLSAMLEAQDKEKDTRKESGRRTFAEMIATGTISNRQLRPRKSAKYLDILSTELDLQKDRRR